MLARKYQRGVIDLLSLVGLVFLVVTLVVTTKVVSDPKIKQLIGARARYSPDALIRQRERQGGCKGADCLIPEIIENKENQTGEGAEIVEKVEQALQGDQEALSQIQNADVVRQIQEQQSLQNTSNNQNGDTFSQCLSTGKTSSECGSLLSGGEIETATQTVGNIAQDLYREAVGGDKLALEQLRNINEDYANQAETAIVQKETSERLEALRQKDAIEAQNVAITATNEEDRLKALEELRSLVTEGVITPQKFQDIYIQVNAPTLPTAQQTIAGRRPNGARCSFHSECLSEYCTSTCTDRPLSSALPFRTDSETSLEMCRSSAEAQGLNFSYFNGVCNIESENAYVQQQAALQSELQYEVERYRNTYNFAHCAGLETTQEREDCNRFMSDTYNELDRVTFGTFSNYASNYSKTNTEAAQKYDTSSVQNDIARNALNYFLAASEGATDKETLISTVELASVITTEAAVVLSPASLVSLGSVGLGLVPSTFAIVGGISTLNQTSAAFTAQVEDPGSKEANNKTFLAALSWANLFTGQALLQGAPSLITRIANTALSLGSIPLDAAIARQECGGETANQFNCTTSKLAVLADVVFLGIDIGQGDTIFRSINNVNVPVRGGPTHLITPPSRFVDEDVINTVFDPTRNMWVPDFEASVVQPQRLLSAPIDSFEPSGARITIQNELDPLILRISPPEPPKLNARDLPLLLADGTSTTLREIEDPSSKLFANIPPPSERLRTNNALYALESSNPPPNSVASELLVSPGSSATLKESTIEAEITTPEIANLQREALQTVVSANPTVPVKQIGSDSLITELGTSYDELGSTARVFTINADGEERVVRLYRPSHINRLIKYDEDLTEVFLRQVASAKLVSDLGIGPRFYGIVDFNNNELIGFETARAPGNFPELMPPGTVNQTTIDDLKIIHQKLIDAGYYQPEVQYFVAPDGHVTLIDTGLMSVKQYEELYSMSPKGFLEEVEELKVRYRIGQPQPFTQRVGQNVRNWYTTSVENLKRFTATWSEKIIGVSNETKLAGPEGLEDFEALPVVSLEGPTVDVYYRYAEEGNNPLVKRIIGIGINDPNIIDRLTTDRNIIRAKYGLPPIELRRENPDEYFRQLTKMAEGLGYEVRNINEVNLFLREVPYAAGLHTTNLEIAGVPTLFYNPNSSLKINVLEHELIHAFQQTKSPGLPVEASEYEAYLGTLGKPENLQDGGTREFFFNMIRTSVKFWYKDQGLPNPWELPPIKVSEINNIKPNNSEVGSFSPFFLAGVAASIPLVDYISERVFGIDLINSDTITSFLQKEVPAGGQGDVISQAGSQGSQTDYAFYSQHDPRWADKKIPQMNDNATWGSSSCGFMVAAMTTGMDPLEYYDKYNEYFSGLYPGLNRGDGYEEKGTTWNDHKQVLRLLGYDARKISGDPEDRKNQIREYTSRGIPVWVTARIQNNNGDWVIHHTLAVGVDDDGNIIFNDPWYGEGVTIPDERIDQTGEHDPNGLIWVTNAIVPE